MKPLVAKSIPAQVESRAFNVNRPLSALMLLLIVAGSACAQDLQNYLRIRKANGIIEAVGVAALETAVGTRIFEVEGAVKGAIRVGDKITLSLERTDGDTIDIDAKNLPDWALGSDVLARLIVKASRSPADDELHATLIAIAREEDIEPIEEKLVAAAARAASTRTQRPASSSSRAGAKRYAVAGRPSAKVWIVPSDKATPYYAAYVHHHNPNLSVDESYRIAKGIIGFGKKYGVDARLIVAMVICESDFHPHEVSNKGAMGLGQLMPETVQDYGITDPFDSIQNLYGTVREIRGHIDKYRAETGDEFESLVLGLAAYNAGEGAVRRHGGVPPYKETQAYVRKVISLYARLAPDVVRTQ